MNARNPFQSSAQDWDDMVIALREAQDARQHSDQLAIRLMADNDALTVQLAESNKDLKFWMGYAIQIETRLDVIAGVIQDARNEARESAVRHAAERPAQLPPETKPAAEPSKPTLATVRRPVEIRHAAPAIEDEPGPSAQDIVASLPQRLSNTWP